MVQRGGRASDTTGGSGLGGRRALDEADDDQEEIDLSTGSHTRRELLPTGGGSGRYAHMGLPQTIHDPKNPTKMAGPNPPVASAPTSASWSTHIGSVFSGLTQQVQATTSSGPSSSNGNYQRPHPIHFKNTTTNYFNTVTVLHDHPISKLKPSS